MKIEKTKQVTITFNVEEIKKLLKEEAEAPDNAIIYFDYKYDNSDVDFGLEPVRKMWRCVIKWEE